MGNQLHLLVRMLPESYYTDEEIKNRYVTFYGDDLEFSRGKVSDFRLK
jgi:REP-associated tyrosine transposase